MKFSQWLESQNNINFSFWKDGTVIVYLNNRKYVYITDAVYHNKWQRNMDWLRKEKPQAYEPYCFNVLNQIKKMVASGVATQEEPPLQQPSPQSPTDPTNPKFVQKNLF